MRNPMRAVRLCAAVTLFVLGITAGGLVSRAAAKEIELKAVSAWSKAHLNTQGFLEFIAAVNKKGKGLVHIKYIGGPEVTPPQQQTVALRNGLFDLQFGPPAYYIGLFPEGYFTAGFKTPMEARKLGGYKIVDKAMRKQIGATFLARFDSGLGLYLALEKKPKLKNGLPDLTGMKIRSAPNYRDLIKALGGTPVVMHDPQIYTALQRGVVEGMGGDLDSIRQFGLYKNLKYWIEPPFYMAGIIVIANAHKWDSLPPKVRSLLNTELRAYEKITMNEIAGRTKKDKDFMRQHGMQAIVLKSEAAKHYVGISTKKAWSRMRKNPNVIVNVDALRKAWY